MKKVVRKLMLGIIVGGMFLGGCQSPEPKQQVVSETTSKTQQQTVTETTQKTQQEIVTETTKNSKQEEEKDAAQGKIEGNTYTYDEISITFPDSWEGKYIIEGAEDGIFVSHKASYEKEKDTGSLFWIYKTDSVFDFGSVVAYTDDYIYYLVEPSDVTCYDQDEQIANEYYEMQEEIENIKDSLVIDAENVRYDVKEYALPVSHCKPIPEEYLENELPPDLDWLWIARNEIYARHGRMFDNVYLKNYFESRTWYEGTIPSDAFDESVLSQVEKDNLEKIKEQEERLAAEKLYPHSCQFGKNYEFDLDADGQMEEICINYKENAQSNMFDVQLNINGNGNAGKANSHYNLSTEDVNYFCINTDEYYITDISSYDPGLEIAVMDYGMSEDLVTHFYSYDGELYYIGSIGGFPFKKYMNLDGFKRDGYVMGVVRTDLIHTCFSYEYWEYNYFEKKLEIEEDEDPFDMVPTGAYKLKKDIEVHTDRNPESSMKTMKAQDIFFMQTDGLEWIKIKGKDGTEGYLYIDEEGRIEETKENPQDIIEGLFFAG